MRQHYVFLIPLLAIVLIGPGCESKPNVKVEWVDENVEKKKTERGQSDEKLREDYEARIKARENAPEPELDPNDPREKFEVVWRMGKGRLTSIYNERAEMIAMLRRFKIEDKSEKKLMTKWLTPLTEFGIGRDAADMERAPKDACELIAKVRVDADTLIEKGKEKLVPLHEKSKELDKKQAEGGEVLQKQWDKLDEDIKRWSVPVRSGKQLLLIVKSILEELHVLADTGPRRVQLSIRDCLSKMAEKPFALDLTQNALEKTLKRSKWYRDLR